MCYFKCHGKTSLVTVEWDKLQSAPLEETPGKWPREIKSSRSPSSCRLLARPVETEAHSTALTLPHRLSFEVLGIPQGEFRQVTTFYSSSLFLFKWLSLSLVANRAEHHISSWFPFMSLLSLEGYHFSGSHPVPSPSQKQKY